MKLQIQWSVVSGQWSALFLPPLWGKVSFLTSFPPLWGKVWMGGIICALLISQPGRLYASVTGTGELFQKALQLYESGQWDEALDQFVHILAHQPQDIKARRYLREIIQKLQEEEASQPNLTHQQRKILTDQAWAELGYLSLSQSQELYQKADQYFLQNKLLLAWQTMSELLSRKPPDSVAVKTRELLSKLERKLSRMSKSKDTWEVMYVKGLEAFRKKEYEDAIQFWKDYLANKPDDPPVLRRSRTSTSEDGEVQSFLQKAQITQESEVLQQRIAALLSKAENQVEAGQLSKALSAWHEIQQLDPNHPRAQSEIDRLEAKLEALEAVALAQAQFKQKLFLDASQNCMKAMRLDSQNKEAQDLLNKILSGLSRAAVPAASKPAASQKVVAAKRVLSAKEAELANSHYNRGLVHYIQGDLEKAITEWELTLQSNPQHSWAQEASKRVRVELELTPSGTPHP